MTETLQSSNTEEMIDEIRAIIDRGLGDTKSRQLIAASEVADLLLDLRLVLDSGEIKWSQSLRIKKKFLKRKKLLNYPT